MENVHHTFIARMRNTSFFSTPLPKFKPNSSLAVTKKALFCSLQRKMSKFENQENELHCPVAFVCFQNLAFGLILYIETFWSILCCRYMDKILCWKFDQHCTLLGCCKCWIKCVTARRAASLFSVGSSQFVGAAFFVGVAGGKFTQFGQIMKHTCPDARHLVWRKSSLCTAR